MSDETISVIKATAPVVAPLAHKITELFYPILFRDYPIALDFFNKANQKKGLQSAALGDAVIGFASNIDNLGAITGVVTSIQQRHCALGITPDLYAAVHASLMKAIVEVLGDAVTPEIGEAWSNAVLALAEICWTGEEALYKKTENRKGGWRGFKEFELVKKTKVGEDTVSFDFKSADGYSEGYEYDAGQYLTIKVINGDNKMRRHYTVTSSPKDDNIFQCTTRRVNGRGNDPDGAMTSFMHSDKFAIGTKVELSAPFGTYSAPGLKLNENSPVAFVTAGIGATPALALSKEGFVSVKGALHVDRNADYGQGLVDKMNYNLQANGTNAKVIPLFGMSRSDVYDEIKKFGGEKKECDFICCGPLPFMGSALKALMEGGIDGDRIHCEMFGTGSVKKP
jgi:nitric oxide dioxygenase